MDFFDTPRGGQNIRGDFRLRNHWAKPIGTLGYYWFLVFDRTPELHSLVEDCQKSIDHPYLDRVPKKGLHLTLDRIGSVDDIPPSRVSSLKTNAERKCQEVESFTLTLERLKFVQSAVIFETSTENSVRELRKKLHDATSSAGTGTNSQAVQAKPHVTIAYSNCDAVISDKTEGSITEINRNIQPIGITVTEVAMVLLERRESTYSWQVLERIPLHD